MVWEMQSRAEQSSAPEHLMEVRGLRKGLSKRKKLKRGRRAQLGERTRPREIDQMMPSGIRILPSRLRRSSAGWAFTRWREDPGPIALVIGLRGR